MLRCANSADTDLEILKHTFNVLSYEYALNHNEKRFYQDVCLSTF